MRGFICVLLASCLLLVTSGVTLAQTGTMALYSDQAGTNCNLSDNGDRCPIQVYVIYRGSIGTTASEFVLEQQYGAALVYLSEAVPSVGFTTVGRADIGIGVGYGYCAAEELLLLTVTYMGTGESAACSQLHIKHNPSSNYENGSYIAMVDCSFEIIWAAPGHITINPNDGCQCDVPPGGTATPVVETSWGQIKSLYNG